MVLDRSGGEKGGRGGTARELGVRFGRGTGATVGGEAIGEDRERDCAEVGVGDRLSPGTSDCFGCEDVLI